MTDFAQIHKTASDMQKEFERVTKEFQTKMQSMFTDMTKSFFEAAPEIKSVIWSQYTPYFNDGEECIFGVNEINFLKNIPEGVPSSVYDLLDDDDENYDVFDKNASADELEKYRRYAKDYLSSSDYYQRRGDSIEEALRDPRHEEIVKLCQSLESVIQSNEDLMKAIFGDHVVVMLTADGTQTDECSHD